MMMSRFALRSACAVTAVATLAGCSWRLETPEPDWPTADATTLMRDAAAVREQAILDALGSAGDSTAQTVLAHLEEESVPTRLEAFGGVYVAYPSASPEPSATAASQSFQATVLAAQEGHFADALEATDPDLALLTASAGLSHALSAWYGDWVDTVVEADDAPVAANRLLDSGVLEGETLTPDSAELDPVSITQLALAHDRAGYLYEVLAARAADEERDQWLTRRDLQRDRAASLVTLPGVQDLREATYVTPTRELPDEPARITVAQNEELHIGEMYASFLDGAAASDLPWLLSGAFDAYAQAGAYGDATVEVLTVPALPGVEAP